MATTLQEAFEENVRPFIDIIDELRSLGLDKDVGLPAVVVVGDQSSGKSSVLEAISGVELPRGTDMVTRCPLELRLKRLTKDKNHGEQLLGKHKKQTMQRKWKGKISYTIQATKTKTQEPLNDPSMVGAAVEKATKMLTKGEKEISEELIHLEVQSHNVPDLTLVDLPGITRVNVDGQSQDVPEQIKALINKYIKKEETIILAVIPCNADIATMEALKLAQEVDTDGERTLGVLTKPDLVDEGTENNICQIVNGQKVKLSLGYTVVKCRGQMAIENKMSLAEAMREEENFFKKKEVFNTLYQGKKTGISNLSHQLAKQLVKQIKKHMPDLKKDIRIKLSKVNGELERFGDSLPDKDNEKHTYLIDLSTKLGLLFQRLAKAEHIEEEGIKDLRMYGRVREEFRTFASDIRRLQPKRSNSHLEEEISKQIKKRRGKELPSFLSYPVFEEIARKEIKKIQEPADRCLKSVIDIVESVTFNVIRHHLVRFEPLMMEVNGLVNEEMKKAEEETKDQIKSVFAMENLIFTQDENFTQHMFHMDNEKRSTTMRMNAAPFCSTSLPSANPETFAEWLKKGEKTDAVQMVKCLEAYCKVAATRMIDTIPMAIYHHFVRRLMDRMNKELIKLSSNPEKAKELLREDPDAVCEREKLVEKQGRLEKANAKLMKFGASNTTNSGFNTEDE